MKKQSILIFSSILIIFTITSLQGASTHFCQNVTLNQEALGTVPKINGNNYSIKQISYPSNFTANITIMIATGDLIFSDRFVSDILLNQTIGYINQNFPNLTITIEFPDAFQEIDKIEDIAATNSTEFIIWLGKGWTGFDQNKINRWMNPDWTNNSNLKGIALIDTITDWHEKWNYENISYHIFNRTEASFLAGSWAAFASEDDRIGVVMPWDINPTTSSAFFSRDSPFMFLYSGQLASLFAGVQYTSEEYMNRKIIEVLTDHIDSANFVEEEDAIEENIKLTDKLLSRGADTLIGFGNYGDEGILESVRSNPGTKVFMMDSYPINNYQDLDIAYLYPNYTLSIIKQLEFWAENGSSLFLQNIYRPGDENYPFMNDVIVNDNFQNITNKIMNYEIAIPSDFFYDRYGGIPENVKIISGYELLSFLLVIPGIYSIRKKKFAKN